MVIYLGADHRGFELKEHLCKYLKDRGYEVMDLGNSVLDKDDDYPDYAAAVAKRISAESDRSRGVLVCGSGAGMDIAANKVRRIRSVLGFSANQVFDARKEDDANILVIAADFMKFEEAEKLLQTFLSTKYEGADRQIRRIQKISQLENL